MPKQMGVRVALGALILGLLLPGISLSTTPHQRAGKTVWAGAKTAVKRHHRAATARRSARDATALASGRSRGKAAIRTVSRSASPRRAASRRAAASVETTAEVFGPVLPALEPFDLPESPFASCDEIDSVREAHLHDESPEGAEAAKEASPDPSADRSLAAVARQIRSLFRPKSSAARVTPDDVDLPDLLSARLRIPVEGVDVERLRDSFLDRRGRYRKHLAIDIGAPRGTPVLATTDGEISRLRRERQGGISIYQKDASGKYLFFYCHLSRYATGLEVGQKVQAGDVIGYVGSTGHVIGGPHLHFSITRLPDSDDFRAGLAINPYLLFLAGVP